LEITDSTPRVDDGHPCFHPTGAPEKNHCDRMYALAHSLLFFLQADHRRLGGKPMMYRFNHFKEETDERWPMKIVKGF
jgi:hypothetical protein